mgnify:CR=1 FL=1
MKKLRPTGDRVLVLMDPEPEVRNGIIISAGKPAPQNHGTVVAVGLCVLEKLAKGDRIVWSRWRAEDVEVGGVVYKLMREDEILASGTLEDIPKAALS